MTPNQKEQIDNFTKDAAAIDLIRFLQYEDPGAVINNADDFKNMQYLAAMFDSDFLVKKDNVYLLVTAELHFNKDNTRSVDLRISANVEEDTADDQSLDVYNEDIEDFEEVENLTIAECIILAFEGKLYEELNAHSMYTEARAAKNNLI